MEVLDDTKYQMANPTCLIVLFLKHARNYRPVTDQDLEMQEHIKSQTLVTTL